MLGWLRFFQIPFRQFDSAKKFRFSKATRFRGLGTKNFRSNHSFLIIKTIIAIIISREGKEELRGKKRNYVAVVVVAVVVVVVVIVVVVVVVLGCHGCLLFSLFFFFAFFFIII